MDNLLTQVSKEEFVRRLRSEDQTEDEAVEKAVRAIIGEVREGGDAAICRLTEEFDGVRLSPDELRVDTGEIERSYGMISGDIRQSLSLAIENLRDFHRRERAEAWHSLRRDGSVVGQMVRPIDRVGVYVPGGSAAYPSSVVMGVVPARVAGVHEIALCTPPGPDGSVPAALLAAAHLLEVSEVYRVGGAQGVAALAYGTRRIPAVDKVVGPGGLFVNTAKRLVFGSVGIDSLAGPSELAVVADAGSDPDCVAADLLAQAEHDPLARVVLFSTAEGIRQAVVREMNRRLPGLSRSGIIRRAVGERGLCVVADEAEIWPLVNALAPEHLSLQIKNPEGALPRIHSAGAVFLGKKSAVSLGDYTAGPNHILPTGGTARFSSGLGVNDFVKRINVLRVSESGFAALAEPTKLLAEVEGLGAHGEAVRVRESGGSGG